MMLSAYERLYLIDDFINKAHHRAADFLYDQRERYRANIAMMKYLGSLTEERYRKVFEMYDKRSN